MAKEILMPDEGYIVSKTDPKGIIKYGNRLFVSMSGYPKNELIGKPHNILRHDDMPKAVFHLLWEKVKNGQEIFAYVKNRTKNGDFYWVHAHVTPSFGDGGNIIGYHSVRRKPKQSAIQIIEPIYQNMIMRERSMGMAGSKAFLETFLKEQGVTYDAFIASL